VTDELRAPAAPVRVAHADLRVETDRLLARLPDAADARDLATMLSDPAVMRFVGGAPEPSRDIPAVIEKWLSR
jgi:RimJ/RimL family protein N-acetyltransferase